MFMHILKRRLGGLKEEKCIQITLSLNS